MRNRAKCKLCSVIVESFCANDVCYCDCGEIAVDGGQQYYRAIYKNPENFLRIDDKGNIFLPRFIEAAEALNGIDIMKAKKGLYEESISEIFNRIDEDIQQDPDYSPETEELLRSLDLMIKNIEELPQQAMTKPITHYDFFSFLVLFRAILRGE